MSHLTTYNSKVLVNCKNTLLSRAAKDLGLTIDHDIKLIQNTWITEKVDAGFVIDGKPLSIGLKFIKEGKNTNLEIAGDFFCTGVDEKTFIDRLSQAYKKHDVIYKCEQQGWTVNKEDITVDSKTNEIVIQASRYVV